MSMVKDFVQERLFMLVDGKCNAVYFKKDTPNLLAKLEIVNMITGVCFEVYKDANENYIVRLSDENPSNHIPSIE